MTRSRIVLTLFVFTTSLLRSQPAGSLLKAGDMAPDFQTTTIDGKPFKLSDLRGNYILRGKYVLLNFWGTWCRGCCDELLPLKDAQYFFGDNEFEIVSIAYEPEQRNVKTFVDSMGMTWKHIAEIGSRDEHTSVTNLYNINTWPSNILIDKAGKIVATSLWGDEIYTELSKYLTPAKSFDEYIADSNGVMISICLKDAHTVSIAGSFDDWISLPMYKYKDTWLRRLKLPAGTFEYKIQVDGKWIIDPSNPNIVDNGNGNKNSQVSIK